jgi:signal peptidase I
MKTFLHRPLVKTLALCFSLYAFLYSFVGHISWIRTASMAPTLPIGSIVWVDRLARSPHEGDIIELVPDVRDTYVGQYWVKRVIGQQHDSIVVQDGSVKRNNDKVDDIWTEGDGSYQVPAAHVFVMGDNRNDSLDSRSFGPVPMTRVTGIVTPLWTPSNEISVQ